MRLGVARLDLGIGSFRRILISDASGTASVQPSGPALGSNWAARVAAPECVCSKRPVVVDRQRRVVAESLVEVDCFAPGQRRSGGRGRAAVNPTKTYSLYGFKMDSRRDWCRWLQAAAAPGAVCQRPSAGAHGRRRPTAPGFATGRSGWIDRVDASDARSLTGLRCRVH